MQKSRNPNGTYTIIDLDLSKYDKITERFHQEQKDGIRFLKSGIETRNAKFNEMIRELATVSVKSKAPILLTGKTGVGKTKMARLVYEWKKQKRMVSGNFVELNCATLRGDACMSALFGHVKGAFTGAVEIVRACSKPLTVAFSSSMKSVSSDWMNRRCCLEPWKKSGFPVGFRQRGHERLPADLRYQQKSFPDG